MLIPRFSAVPEFRVDARLIGLLIVSALDLVALIAVPLIVRDVLDVALPNGDTGRLVQLGVFLFVLQAIGAALALWARHRLTRRSMAIVRRIRESISEHIHLLSLNELERAGIAQVHEIAVIESERAKRCVQALLLEAAAAVGLGLGIALVLFYLNWWLTLACMTVVPLGVLSSRTLGRRVRDATWEYRRAHLKYSAYILESLRSMEATRARSADMYRTVEVSSRLGSVENAEIAMTNSRFDYSAVNRMVIALMGIIVLSVGGLAVINDAMSAGEFISFYTGLALLRAPLSRLSNVAPSVVIGFSSLSAIDELLQIDGVSPYLGREPIDFRGDITLESVTLNYEDRQIVRNVDLHIGTGAVTALIGPNGSGKSTIVRAILGFIRPTTGTLSADGKPYDDIDIGTLRRSIGVVFQDPVLVEGTIRDNIAFGNAEANEQRTDHVADLVGLTDLLSDLPDGLETRLSADGLGLSGGERQRIAFARAILSEPRLLVLDEPSNHLDSAMAQQLIDSVLAENSDLAVLLVSHDRSLVDCADVVVELAGSGA